MDSCPSLTAASADEKDMVCSVQASNYHRRFSITAETTPFSVSEEWSLRPRESTNCLEALELLICSISWRAHATIIGSSRLPNTTETLKVGSIETPSSFLRFKKLVQSDDVSFWHFFGKTAHTSFMNRIISRKILWYLFCSISFHLISIFSQAWFSFRSNISAFVISYTIPRTKNTQPKMSFQEIQHSDVLPKHKAEVQPRAKIQNFAINKKTIVFIRKHTWFAQTLVEHSNIPSSLLMVSLWTIARYQTKMRRNAHTKT